MPMASNRPTTVLLERSLASLLGLAALALSLPAHSDYDFNAANAVVVPASKPTRHDEYMADYRARTEAEEQDRAARQREEDAAQMLRDQEERERLEEQRRHPPATIRSSGDALTIGSDRNGASPQSVQSVYPYYTDDDDRPMRLHWTQTRVIVVMAILVAGFIFWLLRDRTAAALTARPTTRTAHFDRRPPLADRAAAPVADPPPMAIPTRLAPSSDAAKPIDFHPVAKTATPDIAVNPVNRLAEQTLAAFASDHDNEPLRYRTQLQKAQLDYTAASLDRVDHFLRQLRAQTQPDYTQYSTQPDYRNLLVLLGFYVGTTIARLSNLEINWYDYASARTLQGNPALPDNIQTLYSCQIGARYHLLPIDLVCNMLFADTPTESCSARLAFFQAARSEDHGSPR